jgi:hypothetical protein
MPATKTSKSKRNGKARRRPWTKADHCELKTHSKKRTPVAKISRAMKRTVGASRTTSFCPRAIFGAPPVTKSIPVVFETGSPGPARARTSLNRPAGNVTDVTQLNVDGRVRRLMSLRSSSTQALRPSPSRPHGRRKRRQRPSYTRRSLAGSALSIRT